MSKSGALAARPVDQESEKGRVAVARVARYRAGQAPQYAHGISDLKIEDRGEAVRTEIAAPVIVKKADPRLARLAASRTEDVEEAREQHREIRAAEIVRRRRPEEFEEDEDEEQLQRARSKSAEPGSEAAEESDDEDAGPSRRQQPDQEEEDEEEQLRRRQAVRER